MDTQPPPFQTHIHQAVQPTLALGIASEAQDECRCETASAHE